MPTKLPDATNVQRIPFGRRIANVYPGLSKTAPCVYVNLCYGEGRKLYAEVTKRSHPDLNLIGISGLDWACDMAPWEFPALTADTSPCLGGAEEYLQILTGEIIPQIEERMGFVPQKRVLCGYSLAGMFALWSMYRCTLFDMIGSFSGSVWLPPFCDFTATHEILKKPGRVYLSLGDREKLSSLPLLQSVEERTLDLQRQLRAGGINCAFELNQGGHELNPEWRAARGIITLCSRHPKIFEAPVA